MVLLLRPYTRLLRVQTTWAYLLSDHPTLGTGAGMAAMYSFCAAVILSLLIGVVVDFVEERARSREAKALPFDAGAAAEDASGGEMRPPWRGRWHLHVLL
eukprot:969265-Pleurochrysis_carterae.AAC.1